MKVSLDDIKKSACAKLNPQLDAGKLPPALREKTVKASKADPEGLRHIKKILFELKVEFESEHRFHPSRKFRFDLAIIDHKIAVEYEGVFNVKKSRHTTVSGFSMDCTKYNLAAVGGWRVLRYTASTYKDFYSDIKEMLNL